MAGHAVPTPGSTDTARPPGRAVRLRYAGLAASLLLALGSYRAGALPSGDPGAGLLSSGPGATSAGFRLATLVCLAATAALAAAWWVLGRRAQVPGGPGGRWLAGTAAMWALPLVFSAPLAARDVYSYACQGWLYAAGTDPYALSPATGGCPWADTVSPVWLHSTTPYGPVAVALSAATVWLAGHLAAAPAARLDLVLAGLRLVAVAGTLLGVLAARALARRSAATGTAAVPVGASVWLALAGPLVLIHAGSGAHHDALVAGLVLAALAATLAARDRGWPPVPAALAGGLLVGLAAGTKVTALAVLPFVPLLLDRPGTAGAARWRRLGGTALAAVAGCVGAQVAVTVASGLGWGWLRGAGDSTRMVQWTSVPTGVGMAAGYLLRAAAATLAGTALLGPVFYPWYGLAALALFAVAAPGVRARRWIRVAVAVLCALVLPNGLGLAVLTKGPGAVVDTVAVALLAWAGWRAARKAVATPAPPP